MSRRVMIAGEGSGCGKTTVTCAVLSALKSMGMDAVSFKCGPDYVDPMFHKKATGVEPRNLDAYLMGEDGVKFSVSSHSISGGIAVIEGVMGFYDGMGDGSFASSNYVSVLTNTPAILVVEAKGKALSVCATIKGYLEFESNNIRGVILNNVSGSVFPFYKDMIEGTLDVSVVGHMPHIPEAQIESRPLGLVAADEIEDIEEIISSLGEHALKCIDFDKLLEIAGQAASFDYAQDFLRRGKTGSAVKLYVTRDEALSYCYEDNHELLKSMGAEIHFFSPIHDRRLPDDADGLVIWGGYPELYGPELEANTSMRQSLKNAIESGLPVYAECGGFMYMQQSITNAQGNTHEMLGVLPGNVTMTGAAQTFGYYEVIALKDNMLCDKGGGINAHFSRYSVSNHEGDCFMAVKKNGKSFPCIVAEKNIFAGYQHLHFWGNPSFAEKFIQACREYRGVES